jgi:hypothetical protein
MLLPRVEKIKIVASATAVMVTASPCAWLSFLSLPLAVLVRDLIFSTALGMFSHVEIGTGEESSEGGIYKMTFPLWEVDGATRDLDPETREVPCRNSERSVRHVERSTAQRIVLDV